MICPHCGKEIESEERSQQQSYPIVCSDCGNDATVPFKPFKGSKVKCRDCYKKGAA